MKIIFVGAGNMASALIGGLIANGHPPRSIQAVDPAAEQRQRLASAWQIDCHAEFGAAAQADVVVLAVKPQMMAAVARSMAGRIGSALVISVAAGIRLAELSRWLGGHSRIVRTMPNTPALIGRGMTGLAAAPGLGAPERQLAQDIMSAVGDTLWVDDERMLDAVTAVSGSGPAYVFYFMELLEQAASAIGLSPEQARALTQATFRGAAELALNSDESPSVLRERVTSKGGTTAAALDILREGAIGQAMTRAVAAAALRSAELGDEFGRD